MRQIRPVVLRFDRGHQIECVILEWQPRHRRPLNRYTTTLDRPLIQCTRSRNTSLGIVNTFNFSLLRRGRQFLNSSTSATTNIENCKRLSDPDMRQTPVRHPRVTFVHRPKQHPPNPSPGFSCLIQNVCCQHQSQRIGEHPFHPGFRPSREESTGHDTRVPRPFALKAKAWVKNTSAIFESRRKSTENAGGRGAP